MHKHITLLGVLYVVWGALGGLLGVAMFLLAAGAVALAPSAPREGLAANFTAVTLTVFGLALVVGGAVNAWAGRGLTRHRSAARLAGLLLGLLNLFLFPFGTLLGFYSFWVLLHDDGRRVFEGEV